MYALDLDSSLLDELERLASQQEITNITPIHGDARSLETHLPDDVDAALIANTFPCVEHVPSFLEKVAAVLIDDRQIIVINWRDIPRETTTEGGKL